MDPEFKFLTETVVTVVEDEKVPAKKKAEAIAEFVKAAPKREAKALKQKLEALQMVTETPDPTGVSAKKLKHQIAKILERL